RRDADRLHLHGDRRGPDEGDQDRHPGNDRLPRLGEEDGQDGGLPADERRGERRDHTARRRQGRRAREVAEGDIQMRLAALALAALLGIGLPSARASGGRQSPPLPAPSPADFGQWERLQLSFDRGGLSPDGKWLAYGINRTNGDNELRVARVTDG